MVQSSLSQIHCPKWKLTTLIFLVSDLWLTQGRIIQTTSGRVRGVHVNKDEWGEVVVQFYGIPYAQVPKRFEKSISLLNSDEIYHNDQEEIANDYPSACPQTEHIPELSHSSLPQGGKGNVTEDCLKLNIFSPATLTHDLLPILIWVPGDGFSYADIIQYDGSAFASKAILVVTINYRVGVFGFLSTGNGTVPGNAGLHDILNAIKWIRTNANAFHGDAEMITLAGRFSGAMAISALVVSPLFLQTKIKNDTVTQIPLAKRVILHDGIATGRYVLDFDPLAGLQQLADLTHCKNDYLEDILTCLRGVPTIVLLNKSMNVPQLWKPVIDHALILADPLEQLIEQKFPPGMDLLIGDNNGAGSICYLTHFYLKTSSLSKIKNDNLTEKDLLGLMKHGLQDFYKLTDDIDGLARVAVHEYMFAPSFESSPTKSFRDPYLHFCSTMYIRHAVEVATRAVARSKQNRVFRYEWAYRSTSSKNAKWLQASIGEEVVFAFPGRVTKFNNKDDYLMRDKFMDSWIQFIKTGSPSTSTDRWNQFEDKNKKMVRFGGKGVNLASTDFLDRDVHFWRESMGPLVNSWIQLRKIVEKSKSCPKLLPHPVTSQSTLGQALLGILILMGITLGIASVYFLLKNWGKPRSLWRF